MKITRTLLCIILMFALFSGCSPNAFTNEDFSGENFKNFSGTMNIVKYLELDKSNITVLQEDKTQLKFCFTADNTVDDNDEAVLSCANYARVLKSKGYERHFLDGAVSSTYLLENSDNIIKMTVISDMQAFKDNNKELAYIDKLNGNNLLFEITKK